MTDDLKKKTEDLMKRARATQSRAETAKATPEQTKGTGLGGAVDSIVEASETINTVTRETKRRWHIASEAWLGFKERVVDPTWSVVGPPCRFAKDLYSKAWNKYAFTTNDAGERVISRKKAGLFLTLTFAAAIAMTPTLPGEAIRYVTTEPVSDAISMMISHRTETPYLYKSSTMNAENGEFLAMGCNVAEKCDPTWDGVTYKIEPRLSHNVWNLFNKGIPMFIPDQIAGSIPSVPTKCTATVYGARWRVLRHLEMYPRLLDVQCEMQPLNAAPQPLAQ